MGVHAIVSESLKMFGLSGNGKFTGQADTVKAAPSGKSEGRVPHLAVPIIG